jgi:hypothetical protein
LTRVVYPRAVRLSLRVAALAALATLAPSATPRPAEACAPAPRPGVFVQIAEESAIIVWDAATKTEHFIRRAAFQTTARDFGFLVPTPSKPELAEAADGAFEQLETAIKPPVVEERHYTLEPAMLCTLGILMQSAGRSAAPSIAAAAPVRVLDAQRVAGYDAVVLEADSARALANWLKEHGYDERPALSAWLAPYVAARWKITAFKIAPEAEAQAVSTAAVRMSFAAERPFFPYREPSDQRENLPASAPLPAASRLLRVFFIGPERVTGSIGEASAPWPGKAVYANPIDKIATPLSLPVAAPKGAWLTAFEDSATPRPGTDDLFFAKAADSSPLLPKPIVVPIDTPLFIPLDLLALVTGVTWLVVRGVRKRLRRSRAH